MTTHYAKCLVRCTRGARKRLSKQAPIGAEMVQAWEFNCPDCPTIWTAQDFSGSEHPESVTCSNCYGKRVLVTRMRYRLLEDKDFKGSVA